MNNSNMKQALSLARIALGQVSPNPAVGAIIIKDGEIIGRGYTQPPGSAHAEIMALNQAGDRARGGVMYVTLEPCSHYGRTPPCADAVVKAGISEVHMAMLDPNPLVTGRGADKLERAGIKTFIGECSEEAAEISEAYVKYITTGKPFVTVKFASSLDGKIASKTGNSQWISGIESRKYVHYLRYTHDAIMVGASTVIADDPRLTCRYAGKGGVARKQPLRVVVDGRGRIKPEARIFAECGNNLLVVGQDVSSDKKMALKAAGAEILVLPSVNGRLALDILFTELGKREITSVLVEGGGVLFGSLFDNDLVDKVVGFISPIIVGGEKATTTVSGEGVDLIAEAHKLERINVEKFGDDVMISGYLRRR